VSRRQRKRSDAYRARRRDRKFRKWAAEIAAGRTPPGTVVIDSADRSDS